MFNLLLELVQVVQNDPNILDKEMHFLKCDSGSCTN